MNQGKRERERYSRRRERELKVSLLESENFRGMCEALLGSSRFNFPLSSSS